MSDQTDGPDDAADEPSEDEQIRAAIESIRARLAGMPNAVGLAAQISEGALEESGLDLRTFHLVRVAALAASGAPRTSWEANLELMDGQVELAEFEGVLRAILPIVGTSRYLQAVEGIVGGD